MQRPDSAEQRGQVRRALCTGLHPHGRKGTGHGLQGPGPGDTCMRQEQPSVWIRGGLCLAAGAQGWSRKALEEPGGGLGAPAHPPGGAPPGWGGPPGSA